MTLRTDQGLDPGSTVMRRHSVDPAGLTDLPTLSEVLDQRGALHPDTTAYLFLDRDEHVEAHLSYGDLARDVTRIANALVARDLRGQRVLLALPQGPDFARAFFATLAAAAVAVPVPHGHGRAAAAARIATVAADARPRLAVASVEHAAPLRELLGDQIPVLTLEDLMGDGMEGPLRALPSAGDLALIQYTSGSTGAPKGVMVSHGAIQANQRMIAAKFGHDHRTLVASWLPVFHDMGLVGSLMQPIHGGFPAVLMSPESFLEDPGRWLRAITRFGATTAGAPNFAYDFCVDRIPAEDRALLDLRSWRLAFNGSEPLRARTLDRFAAAFAPVGFRARAFYPCYGMAEATLFIAGGQPDAAPERLSVAAPEGGSRTLLSHGTTDDGHEVRIVDPATCRPRPEGEEGEIWFRGPSLAAGYWQNAEATAATFGHDLAGQGGGWMRTGDLGLMRGGELYVSGRIKDVIILRGRNHYPQDIEETAQAAHAALRHEAGAAFLVEEGERQALVLVQEVTTAAFRDPPLAEIAGAVRSALSRGHGLHLGVLALIAPGRLPRTTSGKPRRRQVREMYLDASLPLLAEHRHGPALRGDPARGGETHSIPPVRGAES